MDRPEGVLVVQPDEGDVIADVIRVKAGRDDGDGRITVLRYSAQPGEASPLHIHEDADEAWYILEGELTYFSGDWSGRVGPGTFVLVQRGTPHRYTVTGEAPASFLEMFTVGGKERFFGELAATRARVNRKLTYQETKAIYEKHHITLLADPW